jgi:TolB-like protein/DNA-binding winged helix-turn-helix (wHTH) protein/tetratricopeptide (TPR) repeat protein
MPDSATIRSYRFGPFHLDPLAYRLTHQGRQVRLERRPMDLLILFVERRGELITRQEIAARLWDQDVFVEVEAAVNTVIWKLRSALRDAPDSPRVIETVPGKGYRFIAPVETVSAVESSPLGSAKRSSMPGAVTQPAAPQIVYSPSGDTAEAVGRASASPFARSDEPWWRRAPPSRRAGFLLVLLALIMAVGWLAVPSPHHTTTIAVLPFENLSADSDREYLADGLHEEIVASLGQIGPERLRVMGRRSTLAYKGTAKSLAQIGNELKVDYLVEGSVRVEGEHVRATARLIRVRDQIQVSSHSYDQRLASVLALQGDLSAAIAGQVLTRLTSADLGALARRQTHDAEAYDLYLRGRALWRRLTPATNLSAIEHYRRATDRDPHYALAWAGIADVYAAMPINADVAPQTVAPEARKAAQRAFESGGDLGEVLLSRGYVSYYFDWEWKSAEAFFRRAITINPSLAVAHRLLGHTLSQMRRHDEARDALRRAVDLDPFDPMNHALASQVAFQARDYDAALENAKRAVMLDPDFWIGYMQEAQVYEQLGQTDLALQALSASARHSGGNSKTHSLRGYILAKAGRDDDAREELRTLETISHERFVPPYARALVYAGLGERDATFHWLEKAYEVRDVHLMFLTVDPKWDPFRSDSRFETLVARCGFRVEG